MLLGAIGVAEASPCAQAAAFREARLLTPARDTCVKLADEESAHSCTACDDLAELAEQIGSAAGHLARGETLALAGEDRAAREAFVQALRIDGSLTEARDFLERLGSEEEGEGEEPPAETEPSVETIRALVEVGAVEEAKSLSGELVKDHPELAAKILGEPDLEHLVDGRLPRWRGFLYRAEPWVRLLAEAFAVVLILFAALRVVPPLRRWLMRKLPPDVRIEQLKADGPSEKVGVGFAALLGSGLSRPAGVGSAPYTMVTESIEEHELPKNISTSVPGPLSLLTMLPAMMTWLSPRREVVIGGTLYDGGARGAAATLTIGEGGKILETETFWAQDLAVAPAPKEKGDPRVFYALAERARVWLLFALERAINDRELELMGTSDWKSYALFRAGLEAEGMLHD